MLTEAPAPQSSESTPSDPPIGLRLLEPRDRSALRGLAWLLLGFVAVLGLVCSMDLFVTGFFLPWGRHLWAYQVDLYGSYRTVLLLSMAVHLALLFVGGRLLWQNGENPGSKVVSALAAAGASVGVVGAWMTWGYLNFTRLTTDRDGSVGELWHVTEIPSIEGYPALGSLLSLDLAFLFLLFAGVTYFLKRTGRSKEYTLWLGTAGITATLSIFLFSHTYHEISFLILTTALLVLFMTRSVTSVRSLLRLLTEPSKEETDRASAA